MYHANVGDAQKEALHRQWREGLVQVVCATIGMSFLRSFTPNGVYMTPDSVRTGYR